jgi:hypothetical protein
LGLPKSAVAKVSKHRRFAMAVVVATRADVGPVNTTQFIHHP